MDDTVDIIASVLLMAKNQIGFEERQEPRVIERSDIIKATTLNLEELKLRLEIKGSIDVLFESFEVQ